MRGLDNREIPASFLEWTSADAGPNPNPARRSGFSYWEEVFCGDINSDLQYLLGFEDRSYHSMFLTALQRVLAEEYTTV
jgi:hypothetical protein